MWQSIKLFSTELFRDHQTPYSSGVTTSIYIWFLLYQVEKRLRELEGAENTDDLLKCFKNYGDDLMKLAKLSGLRQSVSIAIFDLDDEAC